MRVLGLLVAALVPMYSSFAATRPKAPNITPPDGILDARLRGEYVSADPFIRAILDQHEAAFPGALAHPHYFFYAQLNRISYIQQGLVAELMGTPGFQETFRAREPMTDIAVTVVKPSEVETVKFNEREWRRILSKDILDEILEAEKKLQAEDSSRVGVARVVATLRENFLSSWRDAHYPPFGWRVLDAAKPYVLLGTLGRQAPRASLKDLKEMIANLDVGALDYFQDPFSWKPLFEGLEREAGTDKKKFASQLEKMMGRLYEDLNDDVYDRAANVPLAVGDSVTIREVHPNFSIFRGYVGNDCATCFSPGFVFNPFDRYYYAFDEDGRRLGYVGLSIVKIHEKRALLIHTIQGPGFSEKQAQLVLRAFRKAAPALGAELVVLSSDRNIGHNVNFEPIRRAMTAAVRGREEMPLTWEDMKYRTIIAAWDSEMTYDDPKANPFGREIPFGNDEVEVKVTQTAFDFTLTVATPKMIRAAKKDCELRLTGRGRDYEWAL